MQYPRIKPVLAPLRRTDGSICLGTPQYGVGADLDDDADGNLWRLIQLLNGSRTTADLLETLVLERPTLDHSSIAQAIADLTEAGFIEDAGAPLPPEITPAEAERYSRGVRYFGWVDREPRATPYELQRRLKQARVTVLGLGGPGGTAALSLAASGVGQIHLVDGDTVELSNLNRQLLFSEADLGRPKVAAAAARIRALNSHVRVTTQQAFVASQADVELLLRDCDLLLLCADHPRGVLELWVNDAAHATLTPWIDSHYTGPQAVVGLFVPFETPCYRCLHHANAADDQGFGAPLGTLLREQEHAVTAPIVGVTGNLAAHEALAFLTGLAPQTLGKLHYQNLLSYDHQYQAGGVFWEDCPACGSQSQYLRERTA